MPDLVVDFSSSSCSSVFKLPGGVWKNTLNEDVNRLLPQPQKAVM